MSASDRRPRRSRSILTSTVASSGDTAVSTVVGCRSVMSSTWPPSALADTIPPQGLIQSPRRRRQEIQVIIVAVMRKMITPSTLCSAIMLHGSPNPPEPTTQLLIREAGQNSARVIGFPKIHSAHPVWYHHHSAPARSPTGWRPSCSRTRSKSGPEVDALCAAARDAKRLCGDRACEKMPNTTGTMFQQPNLHRAGRRADRQHQKIHADRRRAAGAYGLASATRSARSRPSRTDERSICGGTRTRSPCRAHRRRHSHSRHELAEPLSHQRRSLTQSCCVDAQAFAQ